MILRAAILVFFMALPLVADDENIRQGTAKPCYLFSWGKGPDWVAQVPTEFRLNHLQKKQPFVDDRFFDPTLNALGWTEKRQEPKTEEIAKVNGRKILRIDYAHQGDYRQVIDCIMLVIETAEGSDWYSPFFVAQPELFSGRFISGKDFPFAYLATLEFSGTGAFRTHQLFDLGGDHPKLAVTLGAGRVRRVDYDSEEDYTEALKVFERENKIYKGEQ